MNQFFGLKLFVIWIVAVYGDASGETNQTWTLVWQDEFNDTQLNLEKWRYEIESNEYTTKTQCQYYTENRTENVRLENGMLVIEVQIEDYEKKHFTSGRIDSKQDWTYGRFETRAKMPSGIELWPAIWMMPSESHYGGWPASGEIDLLEQRGGTPHFIQTTLHYGKDNRMDSSGPKVFGTLDLSHDFHRYSFEWSPTSMKFFFDDHPFYSVNLNRSLASKHETNLYTKPGQPFDRPFFWILNIAVGGEYFGPGPYVTPEEAKLFWKKKTMELDYVRVYQLQ